MADVIKFLNARIDEDEAGARQAIELRQRYPFDGEHKITGDLAESDWEFTPQRLLTECAVKRRLLKGFEPFGEFDDLFGSEITRLLAEPYSDHPDFDPAWRLG